MAPTVLLMLKSALLIANATREFFYGKINPGLKLNGLQTAFWL